MGKKHIMFAKNGYNANQNLNYLAKDLAAKAKILGIADHGSLKQNF